MFSSGHLATRDGHSPKLSSVCGPQLYFQLGMEGRYGLGLPQTTPTLCLSPMATSLPIRRLDKATWAFSGDERTLCRKEGLRGQGGAQLWFILNSDFFLFSFFYLLVCLLLTKPHVAQASLKLPVHQG